MLMAPGICGSMVSNFGPMTENSTTTVMPAWTACCRGAMSAWLSLAWTTITSNCLEVTASWICWTWVWALKLGSTNVAVALLAFAACSTPRKVPWAKPLDLAKPKNPTLSCLLASAAEAGPEAACVGGVQAEVSRARLGESDNCG